MVVRGWSPWERATVEYHAWSEFESVLAPTTSVLTPQLRKRAIRRPRVNYIALSPSQHRSQPPPKTKKMDFKDVEKSSSLAGYAGDTSPLRAKLLSALDNYDKENLPGPSSNVPKRQTPKASNRLSLPLGLNMSVIRSPLQDRGQLVPGLNGPLPRRGRVTDGGATSSLLTEGTPGTFQCMTPKKRSAAVAEMDDSASPPKRPRNETSDSKPISFTSWALVDEDPEDKAASDDEGLEDDILSAVPTAEVAALISMAPKPRPQRRGPIAESSSSAVDAHFGAAWDGFTGRATESTSGHGHLLPFEDDWDHDPLDHEDEQGDQATAAPSSQKSGGMVRKTTLGDIPERENRVVALDAAAVPDADGFNESPLSLPIMLAVRAYQAIKPRLDRMAEEGPILRPQTSASPVAEAAGLLDASTLPLVQVLEQPEAVNYPPAEDKQAADPEIPRAHTRRTTRSTQIRSNLTVTKPQASSPLAPTSLEVKPQKAKAHKAQSSGVKKTGRKPTPEPPLTAHVVSPSPSFALGVAQPPKVSGATNRTGRKPKVDDVPRMETAQEAQPALPQVSATPAAPLLPEAKRAARMTRGLDASQAHLNGVASPGVAGPSNSASVGQPLYPPALAQRIWDLAEAGKYHAAHSLFHSQERFVRIVGEDEVRKYLRDHPEAGEKLKPLARGGARKELFLCQSRTFWVPAEKTQGEKKEGPRQFVIEHRTTDCPVGYATDHNLYKHIYKFHLKKEYGAYPRKGSTVKEQTKPAKGKGKARQTQRKPSVPKEDGGEGEGEGDEDYED